MKVKEIIAVIEKDIPKSAAEEWDNVGLLVGDMEQEVSSVYIALDNTDEVIDSAIESGAQLILTHHPMIFSGIKRVTKDDFIGRRIITMVEHHISYYAMHTNYDALRMAKLSVQILGEAPIEPLSVTGNDEAGHLYGIGQIFELRKPVSLKELSQNVKKEYDLPDVRVFGESEMKVQKIAICPGAGKSLLKDALGKGVDCYITGDIGHHDGIDAFAEGMAIIDAGHYGIEHIYIEDMAKYMMEKCPDLHIQTAKIKHPFFVV